MGKFEIVSISERPALKRLVSEDMADTSSVWTAAELDLASAKDLYPNAQTPELQALNSAYAYIERLYQMTMFDAPLSVRGYQSKIVFEYTAGVFEEVSGPLQKLLSLLHREIANKGVEARIAVSLFHEAIAALESFAVNTAEISDELRQDIREDGGLEYLLKTKNLFQEAKRNLEESLATEI